MSIHAGSDPADSAFTHSGDGGPDAAAAPASRGRIQARWHDRGPAPRILVFLPGRRYRKGQNVLFSVPEAEALVQLVGERLAERAGAAPGRRDGS